jgi:hypothetical protein
MRHQLLEHGALGIRDAVEVDEDIVEITDLATTGWGTVAGLP